ncbi:MAG: phosphatidate cytidylyltransferase [Nakamurella sp.]
MTSPAPGPADHAPSRAGRDLPAAIGVALVLGVVVVGSLLLFRPLFVAVIAAATAASVWELRATLLAARGIVLSWIPIVVGGVATITLAWPYGLRAQVIGIALTVLACMIWRLPGGADGYLRDVSASTFVTLYVMFFASFATLLVAPGNGAQRVLTFIIVVVSSDTGGYIAGVSFGKHPMAPRISPKKSWEGFAGSVVGAAIAGALTGVLMLDHAWWRGALLGVLVCVTATLGDLIESMIKRDIGVKDMGTLLPGHGGVMDRMDSLLPSAVVTWLILSI